MNIESFEDGKLVETREVSGSTFATDYSSFNTQMLFSESYMKLISSAKDQVAKTRLELLSIRLELKLVVYEGDLKILKMVWDAVVDSTDRNIFTKKDVQEFNLNAEQNNMPFRFADDLKLIVKDANSP